MWFVGQFILCLLMLNAWAALGAIIFGNICNQQEFDELEDLSCLDLTLWPAILITIMIDRKYPSITYIKTRKDK